MILIHTSKILRYALKGIDQYWFEEKSSGEKNMHKFVAKLAMIYGLEYQKLFFVKIKKIERKSRFRHF